MVDMRSRWEEFKVGMKPRLQEWGFMLRRMKQSSLAMVGVIIIAVFVAIAVLAPVLAPPPADSRDPFMIPQDKSLMLVRPVEPLPPTTNHIFGTIELQYDLYYGCIWGTITAFRIGLIVVVVSLIIGLLIGTVAGFYGGVVDEVLMRFTDIIIAFPGLILAMAFTIAFPQAIVINLSTVLLVVFILASFAIIVFRPNKKLLLIIQLLLALSLFSMFYSPVLLGLSLSKLDKVMISIMIVGWPGYTRVIRGEVLRVKNEDYVEASRAAGSSDAGVIMKHIWPNTIYPILIVATLDIGSVVLTAAALSFIGIGAPQGFADWGQIIQSCRNWLTTPAQIVTYYHTFLIPGLFISFFVMGWNLLGDALRDVLDPTLRRR
jgi:peptide/nickel transport system permease protein